MLDITRLKMIGLNWSKNTKIVINQGELLTDVLQEVSTFISQHSNYIDPEHAATVKYAIERNRNTKRKKFDLDSDSEDMQNVRLTHRGTDVNDLDDRGNRHGDYDSDDDRGPMDDEIVEKFHFGGDEAEKEAKEKKEDDFFTVKKTKEEVFKEIVIKSKMYKAAMSELKDHNEEALDKLDEEFGDIFEHLETRAKVKKDAEANPKPFKAQSTSLLEVVNNQNNKEIQKKSDMRKRDQKQVRKGAMSSDYNYDRLAIELKGSKKARPHSLFKSEKEKALDRREELEALEKQIQNTDKVITDQLDDSDGQPQDSDNDNKPKDSTKLNDQLVDLIEKEYKEEDREQPDEFEAIEESSAE